MKLLGTPVEAIDLAEDRERFGGLLGRPRHRAIRRTASRTTASEALAVGGARRVPAAGAALVRARRPRDGALLLGGRPRRLRRAAACGGGEVATAYVPAAARPLPRERDRARRRRARRRRARLRRRASCSTSRRRAFTRATRPACLPPLSLGERDARRDPPPDDARSRCGSASSGLLNVQFALVDNERLHVIEANPRASRTVPFVSKAIGVPLAKVACRLILGERLRGPGAAGGARRARPRERQGGGAALQAPPGRRRRCSGRR